MSCRHGLHTYWVTADIDTTNSGLLFFCASTERYADQLAYTAPCCTGPYCHSRPLQRSRCPSDDSRVTTLLLIVQSFRLLITCILAHCYLQPLQEFSILTRGVQSLSSLSASPDIHLGILFCISIGRYNGKHLDSKPDTGE